MKSVVGVCRPETTYIQDMLYMNDNMAFVMDARKQLSFRSRNNDSWCKRVHAKLVDCCLNSYEYNSSLFNEILREFSTGCSESKNYASFAGVVIHDRLNTEEERRLRLLDKAIAAGRESNLAAGVEAFRSVDVDIVLTGNTVAMIYYKGKQLVLRAPLTDTGEAVRMITDLVSAQAVVQGKDFVDVLNEGKIRSTIARYNALTSTSKNRSINLENIESSDFLFIRKSVDDLKKYVVALGRDCCEVDKCGFDGFKFCKLGSRFEAMGNSTEIERTYSFGDTNVFISHKELYGKELLEDAKINETLEQRVARQGISQEPGYNTFAMPYSMICANSDNPAEAWATSDDLEIYLMSDGFYQIFEYGLIQSCQELSNLLREGVCPTALFTRLAEKQNDDMKRNVLPRLHHTDDMTLIKIVI